MRKLILIIGIVLFPSSKGLGKRWIRSPYPNDIPYTDILHSRYVGSPVFGIVIARIRPHHAHSRGHPELQLLQPRESSLRIPEFRGRSLEIYSFHEIIPAVLNPHPSLAEGLGETVAGMGVGINQTGKQNPAITVNHRVGGSCIVIPQGS